MRYWTGFKKYWTGIKEFVAVLRDVFVVTVFVLAFWAPQVLKSTLVEAGISEVDFGGIKWVTKRIEENAQRTSDLSANANELIQDISSAMSKQQAMPDQPVEEPEEAPQPAWQPEGWQPEGWQPGNLLKKAEYIKDKLDESAKEQAELLRVLGVPLKTHP